MPARMMPPCASMPGRISRQGDYSPVMADEFSQALIEPVSLDDLRATGELVTSGVDAFVAALNGHGPTPALSEFLPPCSPIRRRLILIELIKVDLKHRLIRQREAARIEGYLEQFPELGAGGVPSDLLFEEFRLRQAAGERVSLDEYVQRFPASASSLARFLETLKQTTAPQPFSDPRDLPTIQVGETISEFRIQRLLGRGAFAHVYLAWQITLQRTVALKVARDRGAEPQTLAQLDHPNIVRVFDLRAIPEQELSLLSMKFVAGGTLEDVIEFIKKTRKSQWCGQTLLDAIDAAMKANEMEPPAESELRHDLRSMTWPQVVCWIGSKTAAALDHAHHHGVLHRDIKPANILLTAEGEPQLADFNVSQSQLKEPGPQAIFGGSLPFMSPEQLEAMQQTRSAEDIDNRSDIYSLGMTLWKLLAGERPFDEKHTGDYFDTLTSLIETRRGGLPAAAESTLPPNCPKALIDVLRRCLAGQPADRFASAQELSHSLDLCLHPDTQALLLASPRGPARCVRRFPIAAMLPLGLAPNIIASWLNILYNQAAVINARPEAQATFEKLMLAINGILFPVALLLYGWFAWPVSRAVRELSRGQSVELNQLAVARKRCLRLGTFAAFVCVVCWCIAGILWPISLDILFGWLPLDAHLHFLVSLTLCGLIAAVYPFFLVTHLALRGLMPVLLRAGSPPPEETASLDRLGRALDPNLWAAAAVPLVGIATMVLIDSHDRTTMKILVAFGLAGCLFAYFLERRIRRELAAIGVLYRR
jgi:serine/threonine protein kinase